MVVPSTLAATLMYCLGVVLANPTSECNNGAYLYGHWFPFGVCLNYNVPSGIYSVKYSCFDGVVGDEQFHGTDCVPAEAEYEDGYVSLDKTCTGDGELCDYATVRLAAYANGGFVGFGDYAYRVGKCNLDASTQSSSWMYQCDSTHLKKWKYPNTDCSDAPSSIELLPNHQVLDCVYAAGLTTSTGPPSVSTTPASTSAAPSPTPPPTSLPTESPTNSSGHAAQANAKKQQQSQLTTGEETTIIPWAALLGAAGGVLLLTAMCAFAYKRSRKSAATTAHVEIVELPVEAQE